MDKLKEAIQQIGRDIGNIEGQQTSLLSQSKAYQLFPTYATLQDQMTSNIKEKHLELGLDALIDEKLKNGGDPFVTQSKLPTIDTSRLVSVNDFEQYKHQISDRLNVKRHGPTAYTLDQSTQPWTFWFDNGCGLQLPDYATAAESVYGVGFSPNINSTTWNVFPIVGNIISASRRTLTIKELKKNCNASYWADSTKVLNPVCEIEGLDFRKARLQNRSGFAGDREANVVRVMYQLGIWTLEEVKSLGVVETAL